MSESGYYPMGAANDPDAPYNQGSPNSEREFRCLVTYTMYKYDTITSDEYRDFREMDEDGFYCSYTDTSDINFKREWREQTYTPFELMVFFCEMLRAEIDKLQMHDDDHETCMKLRQYKNYLRDAEGWIEDEYEVEDES